VSSPAPTTGGARRPHGAANASGRGTGVRVTPAGWAVICSVVVAYPAGVALGYTPLLVLAAAGLLALAGAVLPVVWRPHVRLARSFSPKSVVAGEPATAVLEVVNEGRRRSPPLTVTDRAGPTSIDLPIRSLRRGATGLAHYRLPTAQRGRLVLGPLAVRRSDPFGLLAASQSHGGEDVLWVHPRTWRMSSVPAGQVVDLEGPVRDTAPAGSVTFSSLREYAPGDDRRLIHWRTSARLGTLLVRHHVDTEEPRATVVLDSRRHVWTDESFEDGVEVAASLVNVLTDRGHRISLTILGETPGRAKQRGAVTVADRLAAAERIPDQGATALLTAVENEPEGGALVVVSGVLERRLEVRLAGQHRRFSRVIVCRLEPNRGAAWQRRPKLVSVHGPTAAALADAWNRMSRA
jgi:uncharacterized protein (DUF58 family)